MRRLALGSKPRLVDRGRVLVRPERLLHVLAAAAAAVAAAAATSLTSMHDRPHPVRVWRWQGRAPGSDPGQAHRGRLLVRPERLLLVLAAAAAATAAAAAAKSLLSYRGYRVSVSGTVRVDGSQ